ncbi:MAG: Mth938-like domain-containing protein [Pseudomonadota bacterium]
MSEPADGPFFPGRAPVDAYGNGGFRFAEMSHQGSILLLPSGVYAWPVSDFADLKVSDFNRVFAQSGDIEFLLLGCGEELRRPPPDVTDAFRAHDTGLEPMGTGAAARTYNVLLGEQRAVAAALIAVTDPGR